MDNIELKNKYKEYCSNYHNNLDEILINAIEYEKSLNLIIYIIDKYIYNNDHIINYLNIYINQIPLMEKEIYNIQEIDKCINNETPLISATIRGELKIVKYLIEHGANVNAKNKKKETPLMYACSNCKSIEVIKCLIEHGADVNAKNKKKETPLMYACSNCKSIEVIKCLIEHGADVNAKNKEKETPLMNACLYCINNEVIKYLVEHGADINAKNKDEETSLIYICKRKNDSNIYNENFDSSEYKILNIKIIKYLIEQGADVNSKNKNRETPLIYACRDYKDIELIKYLIEHGANVNAKNKNKETPLMYACRNCKSIEVIKYLVEHGADINAKDEKEETPLIYACNRIIYSDDFKKNYDSYGHKTLNLEIVKYLIEHGADVNAKNKYDSTPLMAACRKKNMPPFFEGENNHFYDCEILNIEVIKYLIEHGADVNAKNKENITSLMRACLESNDIEVIKYLIDHDADVNVTNKFQETPLFYVCYSTGNIEIIRYLLEHRAEVNAKSCSDGETPLLIACQNSKRDTETIKCLIEFGADVNAVNNEGFTALMKLCMSSNPEYEILRYLIECGVDINAKNNEMETATMIAFQNEYVYSNFLTYLIERETRSNKDNNTLLGTYLSDALIREYVEWDLVKDLIEKGANINTMDLKKRIPLHYLCGKRFNDDFFIEEYRIGEKEAIEVTNELLKHGSSINAKDENGVTPLMFACMANNYEYDGYLSIKLIKFLIENGADINGKDNKGKTVIMYACDGYFPDIEVIKYLIDNEVDIHARDEQGKTVLSYAQNSRSIQKFLLDLINSKNLI